MKRTMELERLDKERRRLKTAQSDRRTREQIKTMLEWKKKRLGLDEKEAILESLVSVLEFGVTKKMKRMMNVVDVGMVEVREATRETLNMKHTTAARRYMSRAGQR